MNKPHQETGTVGGIPIHEFSVADDTHMWLYPTEEEEGKSFDYILPYNVRIYFTGTKFDSTQDEPKTFKVIESEGGNLMINTGALGSIDRCLDYGIIKVLTGVEEEDNKLPIYTPTLQ